MRQIQKITVHFTHLDHTRPKLDLLRTLIERNQIKPFVSKSYELHQVAQAHKSFEEGGEGVRDKIVVQVV